MSDDLNAEAAEAQSPELISSLDLDYSPATTLEESNRDLSDAITLLHRVVIRAHVFNIHSDLSTHRVGQLDRIQNHINGIITCLKVVQSVDPAEPTEADPSHRPILPSSFRPNGESAPWCDLCHVAMEPVADGEGHICPHCGTKAELAAEPEGNPS